MRKILAFAIAAALAAGCGTAKKQEAKPVSQPEAAPAAQAQPAAQPAREASAKASDTATTASGLKYVVLKKGAGSTPKVGQTVMAYYTGKFLDGKVFDRTVAPSEPFKFTVGTNSVIKGWDEAFLGMSKGEKRVLIVPPQLAYGQAGVGPIPPNTTLVFEVELVDFQ
ncbi:MAG TPA: FKBP-type peptidyl-prolyl cis-trans isomerase [Chitinivibrionales bacterium]|nr:FKBP-type peptidyl-prolyl cis-trans isomerase [Chitinivibrionales bacterium]